MVNEVAIVRGAPGATEATAQVYFGLFSPTRSTYQVASRVARSSVADQRRPLRPPGRQPSTSSRATPPGSATSAVGFSSLRTIRAETAVAVPLMQTDLRLENGRLTGTFKNASDRSSRERRRRPRQPVAVARRPRAGRDRGRSTSPVDVNPFGDSLADQIVGASFFGEIEHDAGDRRGSTFDTHGRAADVRPDVRVDQRARRATARSSSRSAPTELLDLVIEDQKPRHLGNVLYYVPVDIASVASPRSVRPARARP